MHLEKNASLIARYTDGDYCDLVCRSLRIKIDFYCLTTYWP
jgi:hypothetical protein